MIVPGLTKANLESRLTLAEQLPAHALEMALEHGEAGSDSDSKRTVLLHLFPDDYAIYRKILIAHGAAPVGRGLVNQEAALMRSLKKLMS